MKRTLIQALAAATLLCLGGSALAGGSTTLTVNASVSAVCKFSSTTQTETLTLDPSSGAAATGTWNVPYKCTKDYASGSVVVTGGNTRTLDAGGGNTIAYTITPGTVGTGNGFGAAAANFTVGYTVPIANFQDKAAATYTDAIVLTISP